MHFGTDVGADGFLGFTWFEWHGWYVGIDFGLRGFLGAFLRNYEASLTETQEAFRWWRAGSVYVWHR